MKYECQVRLHCINPHSSLRHSDAKVNSSPLARTLLSIERLESREIETAVNNLEKKGIIPFDSKLALSGRSNIEVIFVSQSDDLLFPHNISHTHNKGYVISAWLKWLERGLVKFVCLGPA